MSDRRIIYTSAFMRAVATGLLGVLLGIYLGKLALRPAEVGIVLGAGLTGAATATLIITYLGDRIGRRRALVMLSLLAALGGLALMASASSLVLSVVAFVGMVNAMGRDRAAAMVLEQAILPETAKAAERTTVFARYNVLQDIGHAVGGLLAAAPSLLRLAFPVDELASFQIVIGGYAALFVICAIFYSRLSYAVEITPTRTRRRLSPRSRRILWRISSLFALDSLAGGFLATAILAYFFYERFGASEAAIAALFFAARLANAGSHYAAAWLASRFGLINTMVFTHIPASLFLLIVPFAPGFGIAAALFLARECLVEMDVPTRQSYVMAMVEPHERTAAAGVTGIVRLGGWATAPFAAGFLMQGLSLATPLVVGAVMKIGYDLMLYKSFRNLRPPEERRRSSKDR